MPCGRVQLERRSCFPYLGARHPASTPTRSLSTHFKFLFVERYAFGSALKFPHIFLFLQSNWPEVASRALLANSKLSWNSPNLKASFIASLGILGRRWAPSVTARFCQFLDAAIVGKPSGHLRLQKNKMSIPLLITSLASSAVPTGMRHQFTRGSHKIVSFPMCIRNSLYRAGSELGIKIKGPDNPTSQLFPVSRHKNFKRDGEGRIDKGGGGGLIEKLYVNVVCV